jgi:ABC-type dipeptide/oligopeptide/nickel transport system permease component
VGRSWSDLAFFIGFRLLELIPVLFGVVLLTFLFTHLAVPDPCGAWFPHAKPPVLAACRNYFGFNQPLWVQFEKYIVQLLQGNWGTDQNGFPVYTTIVQAIPETIELVLAALVLMTVFGILLGVVAARYVGRWPDHLVRVFYLSGWAAPTYLAAIILAIIVAPAFGLPTSGAYSGSQVPPFPQYTHMSVIDAILAGNLPYTVDAIAHLILPATALAFLNLGIVTRMTRSSLLEVLPLDFVKSARMKGLSENRVLFRHALRNSLITTTTVLGFTASGLLSSTVVVEEIFRWPGIGEYSYEAIVNYNFAGTIGVVIVFAVAVVLANLIADILYGLLDPRVEWR